MTKQLQTQDILIQSYAPDPVTCRSNYYYNSKQNTLFKKQIFKDPKQHLGYPQCSWKRISNE